MRTVLRRRRAAPLSLVAALASAALAGACARHDQQTYGPAIRVSGANAGPSLDVPADGAIQIQLDRLLLPSSVTPQAFTLADASRQALLPLVSYDPVVRIVTLSAQPGMPWLAADRSYTLVLHVAAGDTDANALRAIDRAPLFAGDANQTITFRVTAPTGTPFAEPHADFCTDVLPIFQLKCTAPACHGSPVPTSDARFGNTGMSLPAAGLVLETSNDVLNTAVGRVANGSNTGARAWKGDPPGRIFGIDMPIVDPGNPGNSWLLYKLLLAPTPPDPPPNPATRVKCQDSSAIPPLDATKLLALPLTMTAMDDTERSILSDFVLGIWMPYPNMTPTGPSTSNAGLTVGELERVRLWIAQGAQIEECGACAP